MAMKVRTLALALGACAVAALAQGFHVRRHVPRLRAPEGEASGRCGDGGRTIRLLVVGDSSAVGVGVGRHDHALAAQIAEQYSRRTPCIVIWSVIGKSGATVDDLRALLAEQPAHLLVADVVLIAVGVNDVLRLRSPLRWRRSLQSLITSLQVMTQCQALLLSPIPPLWKFASLPVPLRYLLGAQALALDFTARQLVKQLSSAPQRCIRHLRIPLLDPVTMLCEDRFHPSSSGYREWASYVAAAMPRQLR
jgi:lysophospholipase L1-like esterase